MSSTIFECYFCSVLIETYVVEQLNKKNRRNAISNKNKID